MSGRWPIEPCSDQAWVRSHSRRTDPDTSKAAAESMVGKTAPIKDRIMALMEGSNEWLAVEQIADRLGLEPGQVWRRVSDLKNEDRLIDSGLRNTNRNGRKAARWRIRRPE